MSAASIGIVGLFFASRGTNAHYSERARAQSNILAYTILQVGGPILGFGLGLLLLETVAPTAEMLLLGYGIAQAVATLIAAPMIGVSIVPKRIHGEFIRHAVSYGGPILMLFGLGWIAENNFRYIVEHMSGAAAFGLMAVGWGLGRRCASFGSMLVAAAAFPIAARLLNDGRRSEAMAQLSSNAALLIGVLAPTVAGLMLVGGPATDLLIAEPYRETTRAILGLSAMAGALRFLHVHVTDQLFVLERRIGYAALVDAVEIAATIAFTVMGLVFHGPVGGVIGNAIGSALATLVSLALARRMDFALPWLDLGKVLASTAAMTGVLLLLPAATTIVGLVLTILIGVTVYAAAIALAYAGEVRAILGRRLAGRAVSV
jgi:O-antigen/teichoic acid export membrane protein